MNEKQLAKAKAILYYKENHELRQEIERLNNCYCNRSDCGGRLNKNNEVYDSIQQRNDKAIEYIEKCKEDNWNIDLNDLLEILKGSDKE